MAPGFVTGEQKQTDVTVCTIVCSLRYRHYVNLGPTESDPPDLITSWSDACAPSKPAYRRCRPL